MRSPDRIGWQRSLQSGRRELTRHRNAEALRHFEHALNACPVASKKQLAEVLYLLGATLHKLSMTNCALKSWAAAGRLYKRGYAARAIRRFSNAYGMAKQRSVEADDWKAFYSVQLAKYISRKRSGRIGTDAERDMIHDLILDAWKQVRAGYRIDSLDVREKLVLFRGVKVVFPSFHVPSEEQSGRAIPVDFGRKQRIGADDHCFCGSGLPYKLCCGRLPGREELESGVI